MKKIVVLILSILISFNSYGAWNFNSSSLEGDTFYLHDDSIKLENGYIYFWYLKNYLMPNKFGDMSSKVYVKGDCSKNRIKYLSYVWYPLPMGNGQGEISNKESEWEYPTPTSNGIDLLNEACNNYVKI